MNARLKERLAAGEQLTGALLRMPADDLVEMLGVAELDFVLLDCEHGPADVVALRRHIALAELHGMATLVRIGEGETAHALRALDQGAAGLVFPHVDSAERAAECVRAAHYPPLGTRGFATYPRAGRFGTVTAPEHRAAAASTLVVVMIESPLAVRDVDDILGVEGVDAFLVGAADLAAASGPGDPSVAESLATVRSAGTSAGVVRTDLVNDVDAARASAAAGAGLVVYNLTHLLMDVFTSLRS